MESRDYVAEISDQFTDLDFAQQASFSLAAVVLFDTAWSRAANELLDENKAYEVTERAWNIIGEYTAELMQKQLGFSKILDFDQLKAIIKAGYSAWLIPIKINKENDTVFEYECTACPFAAYGIELFDLREGDHSCQVLKAMTPAWIDGIMNKAELSGLFKGEIDSAICCGDSTCKVSVKKTTK